ncbi:MAG TPA: tol-pal system protein YbgF [Thermoanaerobaculia bacterium]|nr:tol-pal system protein YbgF [Thermoanaerobaculia bacterium]
MTRPLRLLLKSSAPLVGALALSACVSGSDIEGLHKHVGDLEKKVDDAARQSSSKEEVAKLNENLGRQASTLLRSNADLGAKFDDLTREMQALAGKLEDANRRLAQVSQQIADAQARLAGAAGPAGGVPGVAVAPVGPPPVGPAGPPSSSRGPSPSDLFAQATADYQRGQYELARQGFDDYVSTYPKTDLSDDAAYWAGECYAAEKKPREAIAAFDKLFKLYPQSDKAASAHLKKALAHLELGEKAQAIVQLQFVVHEYPGSDEAKSARQRLRALGSDSR